MSIFRISIDNDKMGSYKKKYFKFNTETFVMNSPYNKDVREYINREKIGFGTNMKAIQSV